MNNRAKCGADSIRGNSQCDPGELRGGEVGKNGGDGKDLTTESTER